MKNEKLLKKMQEWKNASRGYDGCYVIYQDGNNLYMIFTGDHEIQHLFYTQGSLGFVNIRDDLSDISEYKTKMIIKNINKEIKKIKKFEMSHSEIDKI